MATCLLILHLFPPPHKVFTTTNIKSHIPPVLDLERINYDSWRALFLTHYQAHDAIDHVDATHDAPIAKPMDDV